MPWKEIDVMDQKKAFVFKSFDKSITFTALCKEFGISTKTGYKWKTRFLEDGYQGLEELSRKPKKNARAVSEEIICEIIRLKNKHKRWGAEKIWKLYKTLHPGWRPMTRSTVDRIFEKTGLCEKRKRTRTRNRKNEERGKKHTLEYLLNHVQRLIPLLVR